MRDAATWVTHQLAEIALRDVIEALQAVGVRPLVVKGMVLAQTLYRDVAERPIQDIDLRIVPEDLAPAIRAAHTRAWRLDRSSRQLGTVGFWHPRMLVELETTIGPPGLCPLPVATVIARARPRVRPSGLACLEPELHDHALLLVVNAFKDKVVFCPHWSLRDTASIVDAPGFDVDVFCARVREARAQTMTAIVGAHLAPDSPTWGRIVERLGPPRRRAFAASYQRLLRVAPDSAVMRLLARLGADRGRDQLRALVATAAGTARAWRYR